MNEHLRKKTPMRMEPNFPRDVFDAKYEALKMPMTFVEDVNVLGNPGCLGKGNNFHVMFWMQSVKR